MVDTLLGIVLEDRFSIYAIALRVLSQSDTNIYALVATLKYGFDEIIKEKSCLFWTIF